MQVDNFLLHDKYEAIASYKESGHLYMFRFNILAVIILYIELLVRLNKHHFLVHLWRFSRKNTFFGYNLKSMRAVTFPKAELSKGEELILHYNLSPKSEVPYFNPNQKCRCIHRQSLYSLLWVIYIKLLESTKIL